MGALAGAWGKAYSPGLSSALPWWMSLVPRAGCLDWELWCLVMGRSHRGLGRRLLDAAIRGESPSGVPLCDQYSNMMEEARPRFRLRFVAFSMPYFSAVHSIPRHDKIDLSTMGLVAVPTVVASSKQAEPHVGQAVGTNAVRPCHQQGERNRP